jgi:hypothetical protein
MFDSGLSAFIWYCGAFHIYVHSTQLIVSGSPISRQVLGIFFLPSSNSPDELHLYQVLMFHVCPMD